jgi:hypothetical protein
MGQRSWKPIMTVVLLCGVNVALRAVRLLAAGRKTFRSGKPVQRATATGKCGRLA